MTFKELNAKACEYFEKRVWSFSWEWFDAVKAAIERGATREEIDSIEDKVDYNVNQYSGCDIINAFNSGYWAAREELGLPKCD